jgi:hypothetical protein
MGLCAAGIVAILLGMVLVFFFFPKKEDEERLLAAYHARARFAERAAVRPR